jgi:hypothetical protein
MNMRMPHSNYEHGHVVSIWWILLLAVSDRSTTASGSITTFTPLFWLNYW